MIVKLKGIFKVRAKGRTYYYAWRGGPRLEGEPGTPEFISSYYEARAPLANVDKRKFSAYVMLFRASHEFNEFAKTTQRTWRPWLDQIQEDFGGMSVSAFDRPRIRVAIKKWRDKWRAKPRTADYAKQVLSRVLADVVDEGAIRSNPCKGIANIYHANRADIIWTEEELAALIAAASREVGWAARLALHTGMRQGDLLRLRWSSVGTTEIVIKTSKSGGRRVASVPITASLRELLNELPKRGPFILTNSDGQPWKGFGSSWNAAMKRAGLTTDPIRKLHFHDLRGTAATNLYRAGVFSPEIADILGWSEDQVERLMDRYVKRDELTKDRVRRMDEFEQRTKTVKPIAKL